MDSYSLVVESFTIHDIRSAVNDTHGKPLISDILALQKDCPKSVAEGESMLHGGH